MHLASGQGEDVMIHSEQKVILEENTELEILEDYTMSHYVVVP